MNTSQSDHKLIRLSHVLSETTPSYGNRDNFRVHKNSSISKGDSVNTSRWEFTNNHIGTHVDVPLHFNPEGLATDQIDINDWIFEKVILIDVPCSFARLINNKDIMDYNIPPDVDMLLIRTGFENYRDQSKYYNDNPGLDEKLAHFLRGRLPNLRCIGFDFISLTSWKSRAEGRQSHKAFLCPEDGVLPIIVVEDMSLKELKSPIEWLIVAPLIVADSNGGPVTVFAKVISYV